MRTFGTALIVLFTNLVAASALAQPGPGPGGPKGPPPPAMRGMGPHGGPGWGPGPGRGGPPPEELRKEVMERMRAMRAWKLAEELKLDEATSAKLFPMLSKYDEREMTLMNEIGGVMRSLRAEMEAPKPDNARLGSYIDKLLGLRGKQRALEDERFKDLRRVLTPVQQAKLVVLLPRIEQHLKQRIHEAMSQRGGGPMDGGF